MQTTYAPFVQELIEAWNSHDAARAASFYAQQYEGIDTGRSSPLHGPSAMQEYFERFYQAFPDSHIHIDSVIADGNHYAVAWTARGTHLGKLMNIPPSGKLVVVRGVSMVCVEAEKVLRAFTVWDMAGMLRAIGLLPKLNA
jgi:steroid delta-isomerase-like uncharacterized protein